MEKNTKDKTTKAIYMSTIAESYTCTGTVSHYQSPSGFHWPRLQTGWLYPVQKYTKLHTDELRYIVIRFIEFMRNLA